MKRITFIAILLIFLSSISMAQVNAEEIQHGGITGKSVVAGVLSLIIWPGIGQAVNTADGKKVLTHAIVGLLPPFRFWSGYDALVDRKGGYWDGRV